MKKLSKSLIAILLGCSIALSACGTGASSDNSAVENEEVSVETENSLKLSENGEYIVSDVTWDSAVTVPSDDQHLVFYEIFSGSFSDSDGDGNGDLQGIINRLDYLNDGDPQSGLSLGIDGIWLTPVMESPSYHRYDVKDYYKIDSELGTMDDLKTLADECHKRNVKLIIDMVINHTSSENQWFTDFCKAHREGDTESEYYDMYTWAEEPVNGRTFRKITGTEHYYECNFSGDMPELNFDSEKVREMMVEVARYYLEEVGVDGFRFDAAKYIYYGDQTANVDFWVWYIDELKKIKQDIYTVAEVWDSNSLILKYETALNCFDFTSSQADGMIATAAKKGNVNAYTSYVAKYLESVEAENENAMYLPFLANHDMDRAAGFANVSTGFAHMAANLYILGPGSPFIYYGEEIGLKGSRGSANTDSNRRLAMLWGDGDKIKNPVGTTYDESKQANGTYEEQKGDELSLYNYYKKLIMIRKANPEIFLGDYTALEFADTKLGGFLATYENSTVGVFHNTTDSEITVDISTVTDYKFTTVENVIGFCDNIASLDGTTLTISAQTSAVLR